MLCTGRRIMSLVVGQSWDLLRPMQMLFWDSYTWIMSIYDIDDTVITDAAYCGPWPSTTPCNLLSEHESGQSRLRSRSFVHSRLCIQASLMYRVSEFRLRTKRPVRSCLGTKSFGQSRLCTILGSGRNIYNNMWYEILLETEIDWQLSLGAVFTFCSVCLTCLYSMFVG